MDLVTGASGHIGNTIVRDLLADGRRVRVLVHTPDRRSLRGLDVDAVSGDVRDLDSLRRAMRGVDTVYHVAGRISIRGGQGGLVREVNVDGAANAARAALEHGVARFVHVSSIHAFEQTPLDRPLDEERPRVDPASRRPTYDRSKAAGEREVRKAVEAGLDAVIVHPTGVVGPNDFEPSRMGRALLALYHRRLPSLVEGGFDWVDVRDVAAGTIEAARRGRTGASYILSGHWRSMAELATLVEGVGGRPPRLVCPMPVARLAAPWVEIWSTLTGREPLFTRESLAALRANRAIDRTKAQRELGFAVRPIEETVRDLFAWFADRGRLEPLARA